jgi:hypothetical protein
MSGDPKLTRPELLALAAQAAGGGDPGPSVVPEPPKPAPGQDSSPAALPEPFPGEQIPVAASKEDLQGPGTLATAIVAPKSGDIPVTAGTPVVVIAKHLLDSPTVQKLIRVGYLAWLAFAGYVGIKILANGSIFGIDWLPVLRTGLDAAVVSALAAYGISLKSKDNDPVISASLSGSKAKDDAAAKGVP